MVDPRSTGPNFGDDATLTAGERGLADSQSTARRSASSPTPGTCVGRYLLERQIGEGAMGTVFRAFDPQLDRPVAIKLVRADARIDAAMAAGRHRRLLREAKALAKLAHPNVVTVHDVGIVGDDIFVAMELVDGVDLREWLRAQSRTWPEVLDIFIAVAEGLVAAHRLGVVHRDVKPANVLVGRDGRVRVVDFGLARNDPTMYEEEPTPAADASMMAPRGLVEGTPAYMAPEQMLGDEPRPASDQFSYCLALYEGLFGARPFDAPSIGERLERIDRGPPEPPRSIRVPARLVRAITRGLRSDPAQRFESMEALRDELAALRRRGRTTRTIVASSVVSATVAASIAVLVSAAPDEIASCPGADGPAALWNEGVARGMTDAFLATGHPLAEINATSVRAVIDERLGRWSKIHEQACRATRLDRVASEADLAERLSCLDRQLASADALIALLGRAQADIVPAAIDAAYALPHADRCLESSTVPTPADVPLGDDARRVRARLDEAVALYRAGRTRASADLVEPLLAEAATIGSDRLSGEIHQAHADALDRLGEYERALAGFAESLRFASRARDHSGATRAAAAMLFLHAESLADPKTAQALAPTVEAIAATTPSDDDRGLVEHALGAAALAIGDPEAATRHLEHAIELRGRALGQDHPEVARMHVGLATVRRIAQDPVAATAALDHAEQIFVRVYPADHPSFADVLAGRANLASTDGDHDRAAELERRALAIRELNYGPDHVQVAASLNNIGAYLIAAGRRGEALDPMRRAVASLERALGPDHLSVGKASANLAEALLATDAAAQALPLAERGVEITTRFEGHHRERADALLVLALVLDAVGTDPVRTRDVAAQSLAAYGEADALDLPWVEDAKALAEGRKPQSG